MCFFSPIRNDPKKTPLKQNVGTHPVPGQSRKFVYVYVFFLSLKKVSRECPRSVQDNFLHCLDALGTLFGDTPSDTPVFGDTLGDTPGTQCL